MVDCKGTIFSNSNVCTIISRSRVDCMADPALLVVVPLHVAWRPATACFVLHDKQGGRRLQKATGRKYHTYIVYGFRIQKYLFVMKWQYVLSVKKIIHGRFYGILNAVNIFGIMSEKANI